jgi:DNA repair exonuclease SbcCD ATPase subunit
VAEVGITIDDVKDVIEKEYGLKEFLKQIREMEKVLGGRIEGMSKDLKTHDEVLGDVKGQTAELKRLSARIEALHQQVQELKKEAAGMADVKAVQASVKAVEKEVDALEGRVKKLEK